MNLRQRRRRIACGAAVLLALALVAACQPTRIAPGASDGAAGLAVDAGERLAAALTALTRGYTFEATVTVDGKLATRATGRSLRGGSEFLIQSQGAEITYRTIPPKAWVHDADAGWTELDAGSPLGDPIQALLAPKSIAQVGGDDGVLNLRAIYPAAAFGLPGDVIAVDIAVFRDGAIRTMYTAASPAGPAVSETQLTPAAGLTPIVAPAMTK
jgi:hypothetical protein